MMQPALLIDEIIRHIFYYSSEDGPSTLNALARSCKSWADPALDLMWMRLSTITPLLYLIPGVRLDNGVYVLDSSIFPHDLLRFRVYASRVKYISHRRHIQVHPDILSLLTDCNSARPHTELLPSLLSAQLSSSACDTIQTSLSLSHQLRHVDLDLGFNSRNPKNFPAIIVSQYLEMVARIAPELQRLSVRGSLSEDLLGTMSSMRNLRSLSLRAGSSLTTDAFLAIMNFQNLAELELHASHLDIDELSDTLPNQGQPILPALKKLHMRAQGPVLELVLGTLHTESLHTLDIEAEGHPVSWRPIFQAICSNAASTLENLTVEHHIELDEMDIDSGPSAAPPSHTTTTSELIPNTQIPSNDMLILTDLIHLRRLVLDTTIPPAIGDQELSTLISRWPELEHLDLGSMPVSGCVRRRATPPLTLQSLVALATKSSKLTTLALPVDLQKVDDTEIPANTPNHSGLKRLTFGGPPPADPLQLARYLHRLFPSLMEVDSISEDEELWLSTQAALRTLCLPTTS
ncbi:hypothetical protein Hypma_008999 [Hypsizygus marmoreus]|uniref:F-box domain-containing protein n=1 Tax=Hypsizygus marmoreus TaxID=39966 RepID=A0A369JQI7_HYPMA|nr:hypothetical protein Hypma_008999 [Hypsizygus marmoreus]